MRAVGAEFGADSEGPSSIGTANIPRSAMSRLDTYIAANSPFTPLLGATRTVIALALLLTLLFTPTDQVFFRSEAIPSGVICATSGSKYSLFCFASEMGTLEAARWIAIALLAIVASGVLPAITAIPHWYVTWSFMSTSTAVDGGDHLAANLTLLLIPLALLDRRIWHWKRDTSYHKQSPWIAYTAYGALGLWIAQVMGVYFQATIAKFAVLEWSDGTALWYWMQNPTFGPPGLLGDAILGTLQFLPLSIAATYGTLLLQLTLTFAAFYTYRFRMVYLLLAVLFHVAIATTMGLWSFSLIMMAADLLFLLRPHESNRWPETGHIGSFGRAS